ncbi:MAG: beta-ketoacyl-[acyl-carrier-protein] synthase family protein [Candidatus Tritonobacter lacicola]|nr:beta-ketoacyl-[acyl-carrier-protein] synthase family protein [Candidatus Tritonobacter lacicola]
MERIVITGFAFATPAGSEPEAVWDKVSKGACDGNFREVPVSDARSIRVGRLPEGEGAGGGRDPFVEIAVNRSAEAAGVAGLLGDEEALRTAGVTVSSSKGGLYTVEAGHAAFLERGQEGLYRNFITNVMGSSAGTAIARRLGARGPVINCVSACSTGAHSVMLGASWIRDGEAKVVIAGSSEVSLTPTVLAAFYKMGVLTRGVMRPFDIRRDGFIPGDGCGVIVLEALSSALRRGADILCELTGWSSRADAYHMTSMNPDGAAIAGALSAAILRAGLKPGDVDYINAHGTATPLNDVAETRGIKQAFGEYAGSVSISSTKPVTGHLLGAAGAVELILTVLAMGRDFVPPTAGMEEPDPECDLDYTPLEGRARPIRNAVSLSYGFGGHVAALVISKVK